MFAVPVPPPDSTTSGYSVPWTRNSQASPCWPASSVICLAARSNARMNSRPMIFRFCSGSVTPARAERNASASSHHQLDPGRGHEVLLHLLRLALA